MGKKRSMSPGLRKQLEAGVRKSRRQTLWRMLFKRGDGVVCCFLCEKPITKPEYATLEHILPLSKGGTDEMHNLALSHQKCNNQGGDKLLPEEVYDE